MSNRSTDKWMQNAVDGWWFKRPWIRSAVISPETRMDHAYLLRTLSILCAVYVVLVVALELLALLAFYGVEIYLAHPFHGASHFPSHLRAFAIFRWYTESMMPLYEIMACVQPTATIVWLLYRAYFWNRRVLRLQANPVISQMPEPGLAVWPPPPRME